MPFHEDKCHSIAEPVNLHLGFDVLGKEKAEREKEEEQEERINAELFDGSD